MKKNAASKLVFGAMLACQVGQTVSLNNTARAGLFSMLGGTVYRKLLAPVVEPALPYVNKWFLDSPNAPMMIIALVPHAFKLSKWLTSQAKYAASSLMETEGTYATSDEVASYLYSSVEDFNELTNSVKKIQDVVDKIIYHKESNAFADSDEKKTNIMVISGVKTPARKRIVSSLCEALYTGEALNLDLTKFDKYDKEDTLLTEFIPDNPNSRRLPVMGGDFPTSRSKKLIQQIQDYARKNDHGVIKIKVTPKVLGWLDQIFSLFLEPKANGTASYADISFFAGNTTFIFEVEDSESSIKRCVKNEGLGNIKMMGEENSVEFPNLMGTLEIYDMLGETLETGAIEYVMNRGVRFSKERFYESLCRGLSGKKKDIDEKFLLSIKDNFLDFVRLNEERLCTGNLDVIYDEAKSCFRLVKPLGRKEPGTKELAPAKFSSGNSEKLAPANSSSGSSEKPAPANLGPDNTDR